MAAAMWYGGGCPPPVIGKVLKNFGFRLIVMQKLKKGLFFQGSKLFAFSKYTF